MLQNVVDGPKLKEIDIFQCYSFGGSLSCQVKKREGGGDDRCAIVAWEHQGKSCLILALAILTALPSAISVALVVLILCLLALLLLAI